MSGPGRPAGRVAGLLLVVMTVAAIAACTPSTDRGTVPELSASLVQPRTAIAAGGVAIVLTNEGDDVDVTSATLRSPVYDAPVVWSARHRTTIPAGGRSPDLRVDPGEPRCVDDVAGTVVEVAWQSATGSGTVALVPSDPFGLLTTSSDTACLRGALDRVATVRMSRVEGGALGTPADLVLDIQPTGDPGSAVIDSVRGTTLIAPWSGHRVDELDLRLTLGPGAPSTVRVPIVANRCDAHALAEDKVGTLLPLMVTTDDRRSGRVLLRPSDDVREEITTFYATYCGL